MPPTHRPLDADRVADTLSEECLAMRLRLMTRVLVGAYDAALRPLDLTASQISMLSVLTKAGPMPQGRLGEILRIEKSTLSRNVQRMARRGWIDERTAADGGTKMLATSRKGRALLERAYPLWREAQDRIVAQLGPEAEASILEIGRRLRADG